MEGVLSIGKVTSGQGGYYLEAVAQGREDYYVGSGEPPGRWLGEGASILGLWGRVEVEDFTAVLSGRSPGGGVALGRANRRVAALDLTLSAPKSVSLVWALGDEATSSAVVAAHEAAVDAAMALLEARAVGARVGRNGVDRVPGDGLVGAAFRHRTSRAGDPQLHTHVVVANATRCADGGWRTLDGQRIFGWARTAGFVYQAVLRREMVDRLGVEFGPVDKGVAELAGIDRDVLREFSQRRADIEDAAGASVSGSAARTAALTTRDAKTEVVFDDLVADWHRRATEVGFDPTDLLDRAVEVGEQTITAPEASAHVPAHDHHQPSSAPSSPGLAIDPDRLGDELCRVRATFDRRDVIRAIAASQPAGAHLTDIEAATAELLAAEGVVELEPATFGTLFTTQAQLDLEDDLLRVALDGIDAGHGRCTRSWRRPQMLSDEQVEMVERITGDGNHISVVVGVAGSGKTTALAEATGRWQYEGHTVIGAALAAKAARNLADGAGIEAGTIHRLLARLDAGSQHLDDRTVLIVDEAGMVGTRTIADLAERTRLAGAKLVLVGDDRQLPEIDAGGAFSALAERLDAAQLHHNGRQRDPDLAAALGQIRHGNPAAGYRTFRDRDLLCRHDTFAAARTAAVDGWLADRTVRRRTVLLGSTAAEVELLNDAARRALRDRGELREPEVNFGGGVRFSVGERVMATRNDYDIGVLNGETGTVVVAHDWFGVEVRLDSGGYRRLPCSYVREHLTGGYALTIHKAQGQTYETAHIVAGSGLYQEQAYVALSRTTDEVHLHRHHTLDDHPTFSPSRRERLATDHLLPDPWRDRYDIRRERELLDPSDHGPDLFPGM